MWLVDDWLVFLIKEGVLVAIQVFNDENGAITTHLNPCHHHHQF